MMSCDYYSKKCMTIMCFPLLGLSCLLLSKALNGGTVIEVEGNVALVLNTQSKNGKAILLNRYIFFFSFESATTVC